MLTEEEAPLTWLRAVSSEIMPSTRVYLSKSVIRGCVCLRCSVHRQMFLKVGMLTRQPPHPAPTPTQGAPRPSLHTNQFEEEKTAKRERDWSMKVPPSFRLPVLANFIIPVTHFSTKINMKGEKPAALSADP